MTVPSIIVAGESRKLGLLPPSAATCFPMYAKAGPSWTREQVIEQITDSSWKPAVELYNDDWIKDQDGRGACAGYAAALALEQAENKAGKPRIKLSGDAAYAATNGGQDNGAPLEANMRNIADNGIPPESLVPRWEYRANRIPKEAWEAGREHKGFECYALKTELELASAIAAGFSTVIAVHAGNGGLSPDSLIAWKNGVGNHSVACDDVRFRNNRFEFQIPNSWGLRWGDRGRGWLTWANHLSNPARYHMFYAIRAVV